MKRIVVKVGSSSLTDRTGAIDKQKMHDLVDQLADLRQPHVQVTLVSSGAVAAGLGKLGWSRAQITIPEKQAAAAVGQVLLVEQYQKLLGAKQVHSGQILLTRSDIAHRNRYIHIRNTLETLLRNEIIPIVNENDTVAVDEIRFGDNDTLSSLVALVTGADQLILLTDIDGLYTANPNEDATASKISDVKEITAEMKAAAGSAGSERGTGGMQTKLMAAEIAMQSGVDVVIASSTERGVLRRICQGEKLGTYFHASGRYSSRKSWIAYGTTTHGTLTIDNGAAHALLNRSGSLLFAGISDISGDFHEGDVVQILGPQGQLIAKGVSSFSAHDLQLLLQRKQAHESLQKLHAVVHRDYMAILKQEERFEWN